MNTQKDLNRKKQARAKRTNARVRSVSSLPRLAVFRSNRYTYGQLIDDKKGQTLVAASSREVKAKGKKGEIAAKVGELLAERALAKGIKRAVLDRRSYQYHGRVEALAEAARKKGLAI